MRRRFGSLNVEYAVYRVESVPSGSARLMVIMPGARHSSPRATLVPRRDVAYETRCIEHNFAWPTDGIVCEQSAQRRGLGCELMPASRSREWNRCAV